LVRLSEPADGIHTGIFERALGPRAKVTQMMPINTTGGCPITQRTGHRTALYLLASLESGTPQDVSPAGTPSGLPEDGLAKALELDGGDVLQKDAREREALSFTYGSVQSLEICSMHGLSMLFVRSKQILTAAPLVVIVALLGILATTADALDLVAFTGITGPLTSALTQLGTLTPGVKAIVGVVAFAIALFGLSILRNFGPAVYFVGVCIFAAVGLVVGGSIMGATVSML
jgi:hypothetical protein